MLDSAGTLVFVLMSVVTLVFFGYLFISEAITRSRMKRSLRRAVAPEREKSGQ
jgi:hypothetical protein